MSKIRYNSVLATITNTNNELFVIREIRELRIIDPWFFSFGVLQWSGIPL